MIFFFSVFLELSLFVLILLRGGDPFTLSTHLREVAYCDVIKRQKTSLLTLSADIRQNEMFKEKSGIFARIFTKQWIKIYFYPNRMLATWRGIVRACSCHALQRGHLV